MLLRPFPQVFQVMMPEPPQLEVVVNRYQDDRMARLIRLFEMQRRLPIRRLPRRLVGAVAVAEEVDGIGEEVNGMGEEVNGMGEEVNDVAEEVNGVAEEVNDVAEEVNDVAEEVNDVAEEVNGVAEEVNE